MENQQVACNTFLTSSWVPLVLRLIAYPNNCRSEAQIQEYFLPKRQKERLRRGRQDRRKGAAGSGRRPPGEIESAVAPAAPEEAVALNSISE